MNTEEIFGRVAKENMKEFNMGKFKDTHKTLFGVIMACMELTHQMGYNAGHAIGYNQGLHTLNNKP